MTSIVQRREQTPPPPDLDESYWAALMREGEFAETVPVDSFGRSHDLLTPILANGHGKPLEQPAKLSEIEQAWETLRQILHNDSVIELTVSGFNRGGLLVEFQGIRGFVPASQLLEFPETPNSFIRRQALNAYIGKTLRLRVIELNQGQNRLIFSERAASAQPGERAGILSKLQSGDRVQGTITNLCDFGAFVDIGGLEGLIHISELSWGRVSHPADLLRRGQRVEAYVLEVNPDANRIALSLKRLHPDPWATVDQRYRIGELVEGVITNVVDFGAFARIEEGLEGLIHVSELAEGHFLHPRNVVSEGQRIVARIMSIDGRARRLGLTLRSTNL